VKILYLITRSELGGAQVHVLDLLANLPPEFKPVVVTGEAGYLCDQAAKLGVPVIHVPSLVQKIHPLKDLFALRDITRIIRQQTPALVHAHTWSFADGIPRFQRWLALPFERMAASGNGRIIAVSQANRAIALRRAIAKESDLITIWNGIPDVPHRASPGHGNPLTLIMTARFAPQKDHQLLVQAIEGLHGNWQVWLLGDGPTRAEIEQAVDRAGLRNRVHFLGGRSDTPQLLASADLFVLATKWEGLPLSILEAMRAGLPVVATNVGGISEAVTDYETGILVEAGNAAMLRSKLQELITSKELLRTMGSAGRVRYENDFRIDKMIQKTLAVYRDAVAGSRIDPLLEKVDLLET
jgi:glycosyltransferase involved in cell wall biosynthesis